jgi:Carboxypeptidase regulatory-like domain
MKVNWVLRGKAVGNLRVYEGNDSGRATFAWALGQEYLLFLSYAANDKSWQLDGCGNSGPLAYASAALSEINAIKTTRAKNGTIHGVVSEQALSTPVRGVHVKAEGAAGRFTAITNEQGEFEIDVPAGRYFVSATENGATFDTADISYEDPRNVRIEPGGCAQVQFARR